MHKLVPDFILGKRSQQRNKGEFQAVCLFVDTSGFTPLTNALMAGDVTGAEIIADVLATIFTPLVQIIYEQGGFVAGFAGDAFKAIFPLAAFPEEQTYARALVAAWQIKQHLAQRATVETRFGRFEFGVKVTVAAGEVTWAIWQQEESDTAVPSPSGQHAAYYFAGTALAHCLEADAYAQAGEIVLTSDVASRLPETAVSLQPVHVYQRLQDVDTAFIAAYPPLAEAATAVASEHAAAFFSDELRTTPTRGEFRQVVTLFINLQSLPDDPNFSRAFFQLLNQYGGYLCRVGRIGAQDPGGTLLLFWGAPHSYENNVTRALHFILDFQAAGTMPFKAGVTSNLAYTGFIGAPEREEYTCHGTHVNLAARQMVAANWGEIWLDEETARQAEPGFSLAVGDEYQFKGFNELHQIFHLRGIREAEETSFYRGAMVGRQAELAQLDTAVQSLRDGRFGGVVLINGEAGVGKSRLVHEFLEQSELLETTTYFLCQTDNIMRQSLNPFRYFLRNYFQQSPAAGEERNRAHFDRTLDSLIRDIRQDELQVELERTRSFLGALLNLHWPRSLYEQLGPKLRFTNTLTALKTLIQAESLRQPLLIHLEDAHWLDADSRFLLSSLTHQATEFPFMLIMTARPTGTQSVVPETVVANGLLRASIQLNVLSKTETASLAAERLHGPVSPTLVEMLAKRAEGNPFFVEQILLYLRERGLLKRNGQGWEPAGNGSAATELPMDIRQVMVSRLDRLPSRVKRTVQTASILGREFSLLILSQIMPSETTITNQIRAAETAAIWSALAEKRYLFQHILLRDAAYEMQPQAQRHQLHLQAAVAIEKLYAADLSPYYGELAHHYEYALDIEKACHYLKQAGDMAQTAYQNEAALDFYDRFLTLLPTAQVETVVADLKIGVLLGKGRVLQVIGQLVQAEEAMQAAVQLAEQQQQSSNLAQAKLELSRILQDLGQVEEGLECARQALAFFESAGDKEAQVGALNTIARIYSYLGDHDQSLAQSQELLQIAQTAGLRYHEAQALNFIGICYSLRGDHLRSEAHFSQALVVNEELDNRWDMAGNLNNLSISYRHQRKHEAALSAAQRALQINAQLGYRQGRGRILGNIAFLYYDQGEFDQALFYEKRAQQIFMETGNVQNVAYGLINIGNSHRLRKEYDQALACYDESIELYRGIEKVEYYLCEPLVYKARMLFMRGEYAAAQKFNEEGVQLAARFKQPAALFEGKILGAKLAQAQVGGDVGFQQLHALLAEADSQIEEARVYYELWQLGAGAEYGRSALKRYQQLAAAGEIDYEHRLHLTELETAVP